MSVRFDASSDTLNRQVAGILASDTTFTVCCWAKRKVDTGAFATVIYFNAPTGSELDVYLETDTGGDTFQVGELPGTESDLVGPFLTLDTWYFVCYRRISDTSRKLSYGTEAGGSLTHVTNSDSRTTTGKSVDRFYVGNDAFTEPFNGEVAWVRLWSTNLSDTEVDAEWRSSTPVRSSNLRGDWRLAAASSAGTDSSGNSLTLTAGGTLTDGGANPTPPLSVAPTLVYAFASHPKFLARV